MSERQRARPQRDRFAGTPPGSDEGDNLDAVRSHADQLLRAADDAIARALSGNSERFLEATRQSGGQ